MSPKVSVVMPCHNAAPYVRQAIESVLAQTWKRTEVIVVDDGSVDASRVIIEEYLDRGVRLLVQSNRGAAAARNRGFSESDGAYIKFFDADDVLHPELIERQVTVLRERRRAVASAEWGRFYGDDLATLRLSPESVWRNMDARDWLVEAWVKARPMMQPGLFLIPRPLLERSGGWNEKLSLIDDFEFFARVLSEASEVLFSPDAPVYYRSGMRGSLSGRRSRVAVESACQSLILGTRHLLIKRSDAEARRACANMLQEFIYTYYPDHRDLRSRVAALVEELGGSDLLPDGPPRFQKLRRFTGWRVARRIQRAAGR